MSVEIRARVRAGKALVTAVYDATSGVTGP